MSKKLTYEFVKLQFEKAGNIPKFTEYINNRQKLNYICPNGHKHSISWDKWNQGHRCPSCAGNKKLTYEFVKEQFEKDDYIPKFTKYINAKTKLDYICPNGHEHAITYDNWKQGQRCPSCAGNIKLILCSIEESFKFEDYMMTSEEYINSKSKLDFICPNGHKGSMIWSNWVKGVRCASCAGNKRLTIDFVRQDFKRYSYTVTSMEYINNSSKLDFICPNGHKGSISYGNWNQGNRCTQCIDWGTSKFEQQIKDFILSLDQEMIENDRTIILNPNTNCYLELDILFPCKTKAVECNGFYWHSLPEVIEKDEIKQKQCKEKGIKLLTIDELLWYNNREECEKIIMDFIKE